MGYKEMRNARPDMNDTTLTPPVGERDHVQGPADAPVTLVEYGDYQCPYCGSAHLMLQEIQRRLGDQLRFVFRNFPLTESHPYALQAAEAAEAAAEQGKFWEMHDYLFEHQKRLDRDHLLQYAGTLGLDTERFRRALDSEAELPRIRDDYRSGEESGVQGTPTFFINGVAYEDDSETDTLLRAIRARMGE